MTIAPHQHHLAHALAEQQLHVLRVDERQRDGERRRQRQQHVAGEAAVRRVHAHLALDLEALADDVREVVENLRQVAAGVALDQHRGDEEPHVEQAEALRQLVERVAQRQPEVLLIERLLELRADRIGQLVGDHAHRGLERVAGADRARQQVERFRELLFEALQPLRLPMHQPQERRRRRRQAGQRRDQRVGDEDARGEADDQRRHQAHHHDRARRRLHAGLLDQARQARAGARLRQHLVDRRGCGPSIACLTMLESSLTSGSAAPSDTSCSRRSSFRAARKPGSQVAA